MIKFPRTFSLQDKNLTMKQMERAFACNTCRCTGFRPIMDTAKSFTVDASPELCQKVLDIEELSICKETNQPCNRKCSIDSVDSDWSVVAKVVEDPQAKAETTITLVNKNYKFFKVYNEEEIFRILKDNGDDSYMLIDGNTGKGKSNFRVLDYFERAYWVLTH